VAADRLRIGIVGCGDVAARHYLPALADMAVDVRIAALMDVQLDAARRASRSIAGWSPNAAVFDDLDAMLGAGGLDAVIDLAPAPRHARVNQAILDAGLHLYSEKPIAGTLAEADRLIATADDRGVMFLCAPGVAATRRVRWLADLVDSGRYGRATLVVAHHADPGPTPGP
jgi:predicted dehydrogenase